MILSRTGWSRIREGWGNGEKVWRNMGSGGLLVDFGISIPKSSSGVGMGLFPDGINLWGCWNGLLLPMNILAFSLPRTLSQFLNLVLIPLPIPGLIPGILSISSSCLLNAFITKIRGLALLIDDLPIIISFQSPIAIYSKFPNFALHLTSLSLGHQMLN